ncbi:hypothetical protein [Plasmodium yoelii yoelii]|uniref:Uncharacterized protein n=1 Tax=Plasmodium yoelii yoelii TaxID=73239 RepID=Q7RT87_PLAYO|nr:hypothetical protein [Plasmodium yoelii yoelii]
MQEFILLLPIEDLNKLLLKITTYMHTHFYNIIKNFNYTHLKKTKRLFKNGANKNKNVFMYTTISSTVGIVLFIFYMSSKWNNNND